jgi:hypothetical protein
MIKMGPIREFQKDKNEAYICVRARAYCWVTNTELHAMPPPSVFPFVAAVPVCAVPVIPI